VPGQLPANHTAAEHVDHEAEEHAALPAAQVGEIAHIQTVGRRRGEVARDKICWALSGRISDRGAPRLAAALSAPQPVTAHQPRDPIAPGGLTSTGQGGVHPSLAVALVVGTVQPADHTGQSLIVDAASRALTRASLVVRRRRHVESPADRLDAETTAMLIDKRGHFGRSASSSVAKNTEAAFKISFARRSS
jgi:hypothetical protein